jgi:hypothetical protein
MNDIDHTHARFKQSKGVKLNDIYGYELLSENAHRTVLESPSMHVLSGTP